MDDQTIQSIENFYKTMDDIAPMEADKYLLSSIMQKSIRRGRTLDALGAAKGFWLADRAGFWRRAHITALEDIGIGNLASVSECLQTTVSRSKRDKRYDLAAGLHVVSVMSQAVKCRVADTLFVLIERGCQLRTEREAYFQIDQKSLMAIIQDDPDVRKKALALWLLAGTERFRSDFVAVRKGDKDMVVNAIQAMKTSDDLKSACLDVLYRTGWPLALLTPLIAQEISVETGKIVSRHINHIETAGIPHFGADLYTRVGKHAVRLLAAGDKALKNFSLPQIGTALFHLESALTDRTLITSQLTDIEHASDFAMMKSLGLCEAEYLALCEILRENRDKLTNIKHDLLTRYRQDFTLGLI